MNGFRRPWLILGAMLLAATGAAADISDAPPEQVQGTVRYRAGGIGEESAPMKALRSRYALSLTFSTREGGQSVWLTGVSLHIADASGTEVLHLDQAGPMVLAQLSPGRYRVTARLDRAEPGQRTQRSAWTQTREFTLTAGRPLSVALEWPEVPTPAEP